jgi:hypothetical protein
MKRLLALSTRTRASRQTNSSCRFGRSAPGRRRASHRIWKPLQMPSTGPPVAANARTAAITGAVLAIAPVRR